MQRQTARCCASLDGGMVLQRGEHSTSLPSAILQLPSPRHILLLVVEINHWIFVKYHPTAVSFPTGVCPWPLIHLHLPSFLNATLPCFSPPAAYEGFQFRLCDTAYRGSLLAFFSLLILGLLCPVAVWALDAGAKRFRDFAPSDRFMDPL